MHELKMRGEIQGYWLDEDSRWLSNKQKKRLLELKQKFARLDIPEIFEMSVPDDMRQIRARPNSIGQGKALIVFNEEWVSKPGEKKFLWNEIEAIVVTRLWYQKRPDVKVHFLLKAQPVPLVWDFRESALSLSETRLENLLRLLCLKYRDQ